MLKELKELLSNPLALKFLGIGIAINILVFFLINIEKPAPSTFTPKPFLKLLQQTPFDSSTAIEDQAILLDTEPIILKTIWNTEPKALASLSKYEIATPFQSFDPIIRLNQESLLPNTLIEVNQASSLLTLQSDYWKFTSNFLNASKPHDPLHHRKAFVQALNLKTGDILETEIIQSPDLRDPIIENLEFMILINNTGTQNTPLKINTTGSDEIDIDAIHFIKNSEFTHNLEPGYYKILIGP